MRTKEDDEFPTAAFSVADARQRLGGISHSHFYELVKARKLKIIKLGRRTFVTDSAIRQCLVSAQSEAA
jgi:hypothetical protein